MNMSTGFFHPSVCWSNSAAAELLEHTLSYEIGAQASHREDAENSSGFWGSITPALNVCMKSCNDSDWPWLVLIQDVYWMLHSQRPFLGKFDVKCINLALWEISPTDLFCLSNLKMLLGIQMLIFDKMVEQDSFKSAPVYSPLSPN